MNQSLNSEHLAVRSTIMQVLGVQDVKDNCVTICNMFAPIFHLRVVAGLCNGEFHVWCEDAAGNIIDPTAEQFSEPREYLNIDTTLLKWEATRGSRLN